MSSTDEFNIYDKVYQLLLNLNVDEISAGDFYSLVERIRLPKEQVLNLVEDELLDMGLVQPQVDRICRGLSFKIRWNRKDAKFVEKRLREMGLIDRENFNKIVINKKNQ